MGAPPLQWFSLYKTERDGCWALGPGPAAGLGSGGRGGQVPAPDGRWGLGLPRVLGISCQGALPTRAGTGTCGGLSSGSFQLRLNRRQGAVSLPLPSPPRLSHQTLQRLPHQGAAASCKGLPALGGPTSKTDWSWGPAPLWRGLITLGVTPPRKGLLSAEGRAGPF